MKVQPPVTCMPGRILAAMLDSGHIDYATYLVTHLYVNRAVVERLLPSTGDIASRHKIALALFGIRDEIMRELPKDLRLVIAYLALLHLVDYTINLSGIFSSWAHVDLTYGGALEDFKPYPVIGPDGRLTPKVRRKLYSPAWIRRYVKRNPEIIWLRNAWSGLSLHVDSIEKLDDFTQGVEMLQQAIHEQGAQLGDQTVVSSEVTDKPRSSVQRRALVRSLKFARSVLSDEIVRDFIDGEPVRFPGQSIDLAIKRRGSLFSSGHGTCGVSVYSKTGEPLVDLCVYFENTPILDQVVGFALHMSSGSEDELLTASNMVRAYPAGVRHPLVKRMILSEGSNTHYRRLRELEYLDDTKDLWESTCLDFVFGAARSAMLRRVLLQGSVLLRSSRTDGRLAFPLV